MPLTSFSDHGALRPRLMQDRRPRRPAPRRGRAGANPRRATSPAPRTLFHAPSFSAGVVMGALVVLGAAYLPEWLGQERPGLAAAGTGSSAASENRPQLTFEFDDLLRNSQIVVDPQPYAGTPPGRTGNAGAPATAQPAPQPAATAAAAAEGQGPYLLQAASFRSRADAERLRAALLLMDMPAATHEISLTSGVWHRVTVGPFDSEVLAQRALTRLRENDIAAIWVRR